MNGFTVPLAAIGAMGAAGFLLNGGTSAGTPWYGQWGPAYVIVFGVLFALFKWHLPKQQETFSIALDRMAAAAEKVAMEHRQTIQNIVDSYNLNQRAERAAIDKLAASVNAMAGAVSRCPGVVKEKR